LKQSWLSLRPEPRTDNREDAISWFADPRRRGGHSSVSADSLGGSDSSVLQSLGQDTHAVAIPARLQGATQGSWHRRVRGCKRRVHAASDAARVLSGNA